jgi:hypothetical protein
MIILNTTKHINQIIHRIESHYITNEMHSDAINKERWSAYIEIFTQLIKSNKESYFYELEYRVFSGENINEVLKSIINRDDDLYLLLYHYIYLLEEYVGFDVLKPFI